MLRIKNTKKIARRNDLSWKRKEDQQVATPLIIIVRDLTTVFIRSVIECTADSMKLIQHTRKGETVA
jgi:hypothetical protein